MAFKEVVQRLNKLGEHVMAVLIQFEACTGSARAPAPLLMSPLFSKFTLHVLRNFAGTRCN